MIVLIEKSSFEESWVADRSASHLDVETPVEALLKEGVVWIEAKLVSLDKYQSCIVKKVLKDAVFNRQAWHLGAGAPHPAEAVQVEKGFNPVDIVALVSGQLKVIFLVELAFVRPIIVVCNFDALGFEDDFTFKISICTVDIVWFWTHDCKLFVAAVWFLSYFAIYFWCEKKFFWLQSRLLELLQSTESYIAKSCAVCYVEVSGHRIAFAHMDSRHFSIFDAVVIEPREFGLIQIRKLRLFAAKQGLVSYRDVVSNWVFESRKPLRCIVHVIACVFFPFQVLIRTEEKVMVAFSQVHIDIHTAVFFCFWLIINLHARIQIA